MLRSTRKAIALASASAALIVAAAPAQAAGNEESGPTVGDCISDGLYGNEPNMASGALGGPAEQAPGTNGGNVLPTQSPGPFTNNPSDPDNPTPGTSVGGYHQQFGGGAVPEFCRTVTS